MSLQQQSQKDSTCAIVRNNQVGGYVRRSGWTVTSADDGRISAELRRDSRVRAAGLQSATVSGTLTCAESFILCLANTTQTNQCPSHSRMHIYTSTVTMCTVFAARFYASTALAVMRCLSVVHLSRSWLTSKQINTYSKFLHRRVATPF